MAREDVRFELLFIWINAGRQIAQATPKVARLF